MAKKKKKAPKPLIPTDKDELKEKFNKLKNKELRLDVNLAIRDFPEYGEFFMPMAVIIDEINKTTKLFKESQPPEQAAMLQLQEVQEQHCLKNLKTVEGIAKEHYEKRLQTARNRQKECLDKIPVSCKWLKTRTKIDELKKTLTEYKEAYCTQIENFDYLFPQVNKTLK